MGANDYDMNFLVGNDLGNAVYSRWLKYTLSEEQWNRMFDHPQSVNEERAGDAVEVCLATLYLSTLFPVEFRFWGDPFENYSGLEHSIRSFAVSAGCLPAVGSQRSPPSASLSQEVTEMGKQIAAVLSNPAVVVTLEEYYSILKKMKDGPIDPTAVIKEEIDDDNITDSLMCLLILAMLMPSQMMAKAGLRTMKLQPHLMTKLVRANEARQRHLPPQSLPRSAGLGHHSKR